MEHLHPETIPLAIFGGLIIVSLMLVVAIGEDKLPAWLRQLISHDRVD